MEGIALEQLFPQDPAHLGPAQGHLLCHDAVWVEERLVNKAEEQESIEKLALFLRVPLGSHRDDT